MPLTFNIRHLETKDLHLVGELAPEELELVGLDELIQVKEPVRYDLHITRLEGGIVVQGRLNVTLHCECARCLKPFVYRIELPEFACHMALTGEDTVAVDNDTVDLTPFLREDILLEFPQHPLCEPDCGGLSKAGHGADHSLGVMPWDELDKLKLKN